MVATVPRTKGTTESVYSEMIGSPSLVYYSKWHWCESHQSRMGRRKLYGIRNLGKGGVYQTSTIPTKSGNQESDNYMRLKNIDFAHARLCCESHQYRMAWWMRNGRRNVRKGVLHLKKHRFKQERIPMNWYLHAVEKIRSCLCKTPKPIASAM